MESKNLDERIDFLLDNNIPHIVEIIKGNKIKGIAKRRFYRGIETFDNGPINKKLIKIVSSSGYDYLQKIYTKLLQKEGYGEVALETFEEEWYECKKEGVLLHKFQVQRIYDLDNGLCYCFGFPSKIIQDEEGNYFDF
jgi:hypothetical protein